MALTQIQYLFYGSSPNKGYVEFVFNVNIGRSMIKLLWRCVGCSHTRLHNKAMSAARIKRSCDRKLLEPRPQGGGGEEGGEGWGPVMSSWGNGRLWFYRVGMCSTHSKLSTIDHQSTESPSEQEKQKFSSETGEGIGWIEICAEHFTHVLIGEKSLRFECIGSKLNQDVPQIRQTILI